MNIRQLLTKNLYGAEVNLTSLGGENVSTLADAELNRMLLRIIKEKLDHTPHRIAELDLINMHNSNTTRRKTIYILSEEDVHKLLDQIAGAHE